MANCIEPRSKEASSGLVCFVETKMNKTKIDDIYGRMFRGWCIHTNFLIVKGRRILVAWLDTHFEVMILETKGQFINAKVKHITMGLEF